MRSPRRALLACIACGGFLLGHWEPGVALGQDASKPSRIDLYGDPLPDGAIARCGTVRFHHPSGIVAATFAPDSKAIAVIGGNSLRVWETRTGKELAQFTLGPESAFGIRGARFSPTGKYIAVNNDRAIQLFDRDNGKVLRTFGGNDIFSFAFSPDGKLLAAGCMHHREDNPIRVWEVETGKELPPFPGRGASLYLLTFSADGKRLLSGPTGSIYNKPNNGGAIANAICIWDVDSRKSIREIAYAKSNVAFASNGELLAYENQGICVVSVATGETVARVPLKDPSFAFTPDSKGIAALDNDLTLALYDGASGKEIRRFLGHLPFGCRLAGFSPDGKRLATIEGNWMQDGALRFWDVATGHEIRVDGGHEGVVSHLVYSPNGKLLASASQDRSVRVWDAATGKELQRLHGHTASVFAVAFAPDGKTLASSGDDGTTRLWDVGTGEERAKFNHPPAPKPGNMLFVFGGTAAGGSLAFAPDGKSLTLAGANGVVVNWDTVGVKEIRRLQIQAGYATQAALVPHVDAILMASAGDFYDESAPPEMLRLFALDSGRLMNSMPLRPSRGDRSMIICKAIAASADGRMLASSQILQTQGLRLIHGDPVMRLWERATGQDILRIGKTMGQTLAFSPDGRLLAADDSHQAGWHYAHDSKFSLWDTFTGNLQATFGGHTAPIHCIAFAPDGKALATGSSDHSILIWKTPPMKAVAPNPPADKEIQAWWTSLGGTDAAAAHQTAARMFQNPGPAVEVIRANLKPAVLIDAKKFPPLIADLDSADFDVRSEAYRQLEAMGDLAAFALRKALEKPASLEVRRRLELLLIGAAGASPKHMQNLRAMTVLERIGNGEARKVLQTIAEGAPGARITDEARLILQRLGPH